MSRVCFGIERQFLHDIRLDAMALPDWRATSSDYSTSPLLSYTNRSL
ncbi:MAG TPA: hypothetical protein VE822_07275 [Candidatus Elarobacter sp.]|nr:hypothetical protein [Candidatus Elarobacter sp.]